MTAFRQLTSKFSVSPQLKVGDFATAASEGFVAIICNRPDGESPFQMNQAAAAAAADQAGLAFHALPITMGAISEEDVSAVLDLVESADGPILGYCASGTRSCVLWAMAEARRGDTSVDEIIRLGAEAGYDLAGLAPTLSGLAKV